MQQMRNFLRELRVRRVHRHGGGQALRDFAREGRAGNDRRGHPGQTLGDDFMQEVSRSGIEALGRPGDAGTRCDVRCDALDQLTKSVARRDDQQHLCIAHCSGQVAFQTQAFRQYEFGQIARVASRCGHRGECGRIAAPQCGRRAVASEHGGECGAPGAGTEYGNVSRIGHHAARAYGRLMRV